MLMKIIPILVGLQCLVFCVQCTESKKQVVNNWGKKTRLVVSATALKLPLEVAKVHSVAKYLVLSQLGRRLVEVSGDMQYVGDIARSWKVEDSGKIYRFSISDNLKFSDGSLIRPENVKCSINRQRKLGKAVHFDFSTIAKVSGENDEVVIELNEPNPRFIQQLVSPEFTILPKSECKKDIDKLNFEVTSGPYFLKGVEDDGVLLQKNPHFAPFYAPPELKIINADLPQTEKMLKNGQLDFCMSVGRIDSNIIESAQAKKEMKVQVPHIGFTYWLSVNPLSKGLETKEARLTLASIVKENLKINSSNLQWAQANQLFMPGGTGAVAPDDVIKFWDNSAGSRKTKSLPKEINVLLSKGFEHNEQIEKALKALPLVVNIEYYSRLSEYEKKIVEKKSFYHLFFINNDYSSMDNFGNLKVTFNENRPLILLGESKEKVLSELKKAEVSVGGKVAANSYEEIERLLLTQGLIVPVAYRRLLFLHSPRVSLDEWSKYDPEVAFWKIRPL